MVLRDAVPSYDATRSSQASTEVEWRAIQETRQLVSIPGLRESILDGMATDLSELSSEPGW